MRTEKSLIASVLNNAEIFSPSSPPRNECVHDGVILVNGSELNPKPIHWLWRGWLALGKLHLLAGTPGQGKTTIAMAFAATVTQAGRWPDGTISNLGNVVIWSGEDDCEDTLLPRVLACGGDPNRIFFIAGARRDGKDYSFDPAKDMAALQAAIDRIGNVRLIIVDPIVSAVTGDSHKNTETRRDLQPLVNLAANANAALLGITHLGKGGAGGDPVQRVLGSVAFVAVPRVVLVAAKVRTDDGGDKRILARGKSNIGRDDGGFEYHLEQTEVKSLIETNRITWGSSVNGTAQELLSEPDLDELEGGALEDAKAFLSEFLAGGSKPSKLVQSEARDAGISSASLRRARDALHVKAKKDGMVWSLALPDKELKNHPQSYEASTAPDPNDNQSQGAVEIDW
jgi:hypothetical protein